jgi:hypothetical protein
MVAIAEIREQKNGNNGNNYTKTVLDQFTPEIQG